MTGLPDRNTVVLPATPEPLEIEPSRTALIVVDMQNSFISPGGYFDMRGVDISGGAAIVEPCRRLLESSRRAGLTVIYLQMVIGRDHHNLNLNSSPVLRKSKALKMLREKPELEDRIHVEGTWGAEIIPELTPRADDLIITKRFHNGFLNTALNEILWEREIRYLLFVGVATNICVESTLRHAASLNYFPILVADATSPSGGQNSQRAVVENVESSFGWVARGEDILNVLSRVREAKN